VRQNGRLS